MVSELKHDLNHLPIESQRNVNELKLLSLNYCARWTIITLLLLAKLAFRAGIIKQLSGQLLARYLIYLARENRYWAQFTLLSISALPCQINQISDSSRPNNCLILRLGRKTSIGLFTWLFITDLHPVIMCFFFI